MRMTAAMNCANKPMNLTRALAQRRRKQIQTKIRRSMRCNGIANLPMLSASLRPGKFQTSPLRWWKWTIAGAFRNLTVVRIYLALRSFESVVEKNWDGVRIKNRNQFNF
jgi:hypothetical protein